MIAATILFVGIGGVSRDNRKASKKKRSKVLNLWNVEGDEMDDELEDDNMPTSLSEGGITELRLRRKERCSYINGSWFRSISRD